MVARIPLSTALLRALFGRRFDNQSSIDRVPEGIDDDFRRSLLLGAQSGSESSRALLRGLAGSDRGGCLLDCLHEFRLLEGWSQVSDTEGDGVGSGVSGCRRRCLLARSRGCELIPSRARLGRFIRLEAPTSERMTIRRCEEQRWGLNESRRGRELATRGKSARQRKAPTRQESQDPPAAAKRLAEADGREEPLRLPAVVYATVLQDLWKCTSQAPLY